MDESTNHLNLSDDELTFAQRWKSHVWGAKLPKDSTTNTANSTTFEEKGSLHGTRDSVRKDQLTSTTANVSSLNSGFLFEFSANQETDSADQSNISPTKESSSKQNKKYTGSDPDEDAFVGKLFEKYVRGPILSPSVLNDMLSLPSKAAEDARLFFESRWTTIEAKAQQKVMRQAIRDLEAERRVSQFSRSSHTKKIDKDQFSRKRENT